MNITELAKEAKLRQDKRVQLAAIDDFNKQAAKGFGAYKRSQSVVGSLDTLIAKALSALKEAGSELARVNPRFQDLKKAADDLGVKLPSDVSKELENSKKMIREIDSQIKTLRKMK